MRIDRQQTAALVVDYQEKLVPVMHEKEQLLRCSEILLKGLKVLEIPMYITQQYTKGLGTSVKEITDAIEDTAYTDKLSFTAYDCVKEQIADKKFVIVSGISIASNAVHFVNKPTGNSFMLLGSSTWVRPEHTANTPLPRCVIEDGSSALVKDAQLRNASSSIFNNVEGNSTSFSFLHP